jgi:hypothetical protein
LLQADGIHQADLLYPEAVFFVGLIKGIELDSGVWNVARTITKFKQR